MTEDRIVLSILCSKQSASHRVGAVRAVGPGYRLDWTAAVRELDPQRTEGVGYRAEGILQSENLGSDGIMGGYAWCKSCQIPLALNGSDVERALHDGRGALRLQASGVVSGVAPPAAIGDQP